MASRTVATLLAVSAALLVTPSLAADVFDKSDCTTYPCMIFEDNFDFLDSSVWEHEITQGGGGNGEFQVYVNNRSISFTRDGSLFIKPDLLSNWKGEEFLTEGDLDLWGMNGINDVCTSALFDGCRKTGSPSDILSPVHSARLRTTEDFHFRYGRVEIRAKMPRGDWLWPAVWLLPWRHSYGAWPCSGEIDVIESRGNDNFGENNELGNMNAGTTLHWGPYAALNSYYLTQSEYQSPKGVSFSDEFHVWALEWTDQYLQVTVDDVEMFMIDPGTSFWDLAGFSSQNIDNPWEGDGKMAPFNSNFYLILNLAVGGTGGFFPDVPAVPAKPWLNSSPTAKLDFWNARDEWYPSWSEGEADGGVSDSAALQIDYIRVYKMTEDQW